MCCQSIDACGFRRRTELVGIDGSHLQFVREGMKLSLPPPGSRQVDHRHPIRQPSRDLPGARTARMARVASGWRQADVWVFRPMGAHFARPA
jgi:hypothetical protein